jgi:hypothetical protein
VVNAYQHCHTVGRGRVIPSLLLSTRRVVAWPFALYLNRDTFLPAPASGILPSHQFSVACFPDAAAVLFIKGHYRGRRQSRCQRPGVCCPWAQEVALLEPYSFHPGRPEVEGMKREESGEGVSLDRQCHSWRGGRLGGSLGCS